MTHQMADTLFLAFCIIGLATAIPVFFIIPSIGRIGEPDCCPPPPIGEPMEHQNQDGTLKPPTSQQSTDLPVEGLEKPTLPMDLRRLTLDEADMRRAVIAYQEEKEPLPEWFLETLNNHAFFFSKFIIEKCPEGKQRSQALGQIEAAVIWAERAGVKNS